MENHKVRTRLHLFKYKINWKDHKRKGKSNETSECLEIHKKHQEDGVGGIINEFKIRENVKKKLIFLTLT